MKLLKETRPFLSIDTFKREQLRGEISEMFSTAGGFVDLRSKRKKDVFMELSALITIKVVTCLFWDG